MKLGRPARILQISSRHRIGVGLTAIAVLLCSGARSGNADAPSSDGAGTASREVMIVTGVMVPTDGMLTKPAARRLQRPLMPRRASAKATEPDASAWLYQYMGYLLDTEPAAGKRPRVAGRVPVPTRPTAPIPALKFATALPEQMPPKPTVVPPTSPIATGTVVPGRAGVPSADQAEALIMAAERFQARTDLVKLEFAARSYDEQKLSGAQVFELRKDWHVLERARDALSGAELNSALAAGFEANAYINEVTRTIVVAVAGSQDLRRDFLGADVWQALIKSQAPQQFYMAKTYVRSVIQRYQMQGFTTECVGHSLGGGACAYAAAELGIRALVLNPISAGKLAPAARFLVTNYVVDGDIANLIYGARGNEFPGSVQVINDGRDVIRLMALEKYGQLAGPILVVRELRASIDSHKVDHALDLVAAQAEVARPR